MALGLGMLCATGTADSMSSMLAQKGQSPEFTLQVATALGLMGDIRSIQPLLQKLYSSSSLPETAATARCLGLIGDRSALAPLVAGLEDGSKSEIHLGFSAVAIGLLAERSTLPWSVPFSANSNYRAESEALAEILDVL